MKESKTIPIFRHKELSLGYLSIFHEDKAYSSLKYLWIAKNDFGLPLSLEQIMGLIEYRAKSGKYRDELISILTGNNYIELMSKDVEIFRENFKPETKAEEIIFNIFRNVCDEILWIDGVLDMEEIDFINGDE